MRQHLLDLNEIQQIDLGIREIEKQLEAIPSRLKELETSISALRGEMQKLSDQRDIHVKESKTLEGSVQAESVKIKKWEARLAEIRNQREYLALSREIEGGKRQNRDLTGRPGAASRPRCAPLRCGWRRARPEGRRSRRARRRRAAGDGSW